MILRDQEKHIMFKTKHLLPRDFLDFSAVLFILRPCEITVWLPVLFMEGSLWLFPELTENLQFVVSGAPSWFELSN